MILDVTPAVALHLAVAARAHLRQLRRDGVEPPGEMLALADQLRSYALGDDEDDALAARRRKQWALASARYRRRKAAERQIA